MIPHVELYLFTTLHYFKVTVVLKVLTANLIIQNTQEIKRTLYDLTKQEKTLTFDSQLCFRFKKNCCCKFYVFI